MSNLPTREGFEDEKRKRLQTPSELGRVAHNFMVGAVREKYFYNFEWAGLPVIQFPEDLIALQEIIWDTEPDTIIETGLAWGGSAVFYGSCLNQRQTWPKCDTVISIEKNILPGVFKDVEERFLDFSDVKWWGIEASSVDPAIVGKVIGGIAMPVTRRIMVCLDSAHTYEHVKAELELWGPLVSVGCYLVVFDTFVRNMPPALYEGKECVPGNDPMGAVADFLKVHPEFEIDATIDRKLMISSNPKGYLRRVK